MFQPTMCVYIPRISFSRCTWLSAKSIALSPLSSQTCSLSALLQCDSTCNQNGTPSELLKQNGTPSELLKHVLSELLVYFRDAHTHVWPLHSSSPSVYVMLVNTIVIAFFRSHGRIHDTCTHGFPPSVGLAQACLNNLMIKCQFSLWDPTWIILHVVRTCMWHAYSPYCNIHLLHFTFNTQVTCMFC